MLTLIYLENVQVTLYAKNKIKHARKIYLKRTSFTWVLRTRFVLTTSQKRFGHVFSKELCRLFWEVPTIKPTFHRIPISTSKIILHRSNLRNIFINSTRMTPSIMNILHGNKTIRVTRAIPVYLPLVKYTE